MVCFIDNLHLKILKKVKKQSNFFENACLLLERSIFTGFMGFFVEFCSGRKPKPGEGTETGRPENRADRLFAEKVRSLHRQVAPGIFPAFFCALCYGLIVWDRLPRPDIVAWLLAQTAVLAGRAALYRSYRPDAGKTAQGRWKQRFTLLTYLSGAAWGAAAFLLFPEEAPALQVVLVLLIGGLAAGTVGLYGVFTEIPAGFIAFSIFPFSLRFVLHPDPVLRWMALFIGLYGASMIVTARRVRGSVTRSLELAEDLKTEVGERKKAEAALKTAHDVLDQRVRERTAAFSEANAALRKLTNAIEQAAEMVVITDLSGRIEYVNPALEKTSGFAAAALIGRPFRTLRGEGSDDGILASVRRGKPWEGEVRNRKKSGESYPADLTASAIYDDRGAMTHLTVTMRDVTERKRMERDLLQSSKLSSIGTLVAGIAHELNTPLGTILGFSEEIAKEKSLSPDAARYADWIVKESKRCAAIVRNLLKFSRRNEAKRCIFNLNEAVGTVLSLYRHQLQSGFVRLNTALDGHPLPVFGDSDQIQQVVLNILKNAHQAVADRDGDGVIRVRTEAVSSEACLHIENNGPVIPAAEMDRIFDPFFTTKGVGEGTGLGLSLSYGIVQAHGGRIQVENIEAGGVRFSIALPMAKAVEAVPAETEKTLVLPEDLKILIAEDDTRFSGWLRLFLEREGASVVTAANGMEAFEQLGQGRVDCILSDLKMPEMDGITLWKRLREDRPEYVRRFALLTGAADHGFEAFCKSHDIPVLLKPVERPALIRTLRRLVEKAHV